eukprot:NODE_934_length_1811_cov_83.190692_g821_i0.p1 GENE.NODE_934_length_1811_cov_83.190692_g821_i0~~NODE_934_length_1811_cov_83.190692_g821_i0.p1  ORF type:complete len:400 (-),score=52.69 NODE_934_length_1811_cov_83.190692_g821_i0:610-1761(-)
MLAQVRVLFAAVIALALLGVLYYENRSSLLRDPDTIMPKHRMAHFSVGYVVATRNGRDDWLAGHPDWMEERPVEVYTKLRSPWWNRVRHTEEFAYMKFIADHYKFLPNVTVFIHGDVSIHNPMWFRWVDCLRPDVQFASLSPLIVPKEDMKEKEKYLDFDTPLLMKIFGQPEATVQQRGTPACCFMMAISRQNLQRHDITAYKEALRTTLHYSGKHAWNGWLFEYYFHMLMWRDPADIRVELKGEWADVCRSFQCERPMCRNMIQYFPWEDWKVQHGHPVEGPTPVQHAWEDKVCGYRAAPTASAVGATRLERTVVVRETQVGNVRDWLQCCAACGEHLWCTYWEKEEQQERGKSRAQRCILRDAMIGLPGINSRDYGWLPVD